MHVNTPDGEAVLPTEVTNAPPSISSVTPEPLILGELTTIKGSQLDDVTIVTLNNTPCEVTAQTTALLVIKVPFDGQLIGKVVLKVDGDTGYDVENVDVIAPQPDVDQIIPNPARLGDLVTLKGQIANWNVSTTIGGVHAPVIASTDGEVTVQVPETVMPGPRMVIVKVGIDGSEPTGPIHVQQADPARPVVTAVYPSKLVAGGTVWLTGTNLDSITTVSAGLTLMDTCESHVCGIASDNAGPWNGPVAVSGPEGTDIFQLTIEEGELVSPVLNSVSPQPAFRGQTLTFTGENLFEVNAVVIGGQAQSIDFLDDNEIRITIHEDTPMGLEHAFVSGGAGSNLIPLTILAPFPQADPEPDTLDDIITDNDVADSTGKSDSAAVESDTTPSPADDEGCQTGGHSSTIWLLFVALFALSRTRRISRFPLGP